MVLTTSASFFSLRFWQSRYEYFCRRRLISLRINGRKPETDPLWSETNKNRDVTSHKYWATRSSVRSFARTALSWESEFLMSQNDLVLSHSADRAEAANKAKGGNE